MTHNARCATAKPKSPCRCKCGGIYHGVDNIQNPQKETVVDRTLNSNIRGEAGMFIAKLRGEKMKCTCNKPFYLNHFLGYPHDGGLADEDGNRWWIYHECPQCDYQWSFGKIEHRVSQFKGEL